VEKQYQYDLSRTLDEIRPIYKFDETCQGTVPEAIIAFLESDGFEDAIRKAVSLGGDSDTLAAITGSIAEGAYGVPEEITNQAFIRLDNLRNIRLAKNSWLVLVRWNEWMRSGHNTNLPAEPIPNRPLYELLLPFIDYFDQHPEQEWSESTKKNGVFTLPYCNYSVEVDKFVRVLNTCCKTDTSYIETIGVHGIKDREDLVAAIPSANVELLLAMLRLFISKERFSEGLVDGAIQDGIFAGILKRLRELHNADIST